MLLNRFNNVMWEIHARRILRLLDSQRGWRSQLGHRRAVIDEMNRQRPPHSGWIYASAFFTWTPPHIDFNPRG